MDLTPAEIDELLAAWALGALDDDQQAEIDQLLASRPDLAPDAPAFRSLVALLGEGEAVTPPPDLRSAVLAAAAARAPAPPAATGELALVRHQIAALHQLLGELGDAEWTNPARPYDWTVQGLVAHLGQIEGYVARQLGLTGDGPETGATHHLQVGADAIAAEGALPPADTAARWHAAALAVVDRLEAGRGPDLDDLVMIHGFPFSVRGLLVARAFELWTHGDDIRRATGRALAAPPPADLRTMSAFSVSTLPLVAALDQADPELAPTRVVLTGEGGGTFDLGPEGAERQLLLVLDVVDYCRVVARRTSVDDLPDAVVEGERALADRLVAAAQIFAV